MATVIYRLEKQDDAKRTLYVEFQQEARNAVRRLWNVIQNGLSIAKNEVENFHTPEDAATYLKNQRGHYEKLGFKEPAPAAAPAAKSSEASADSFQE